MYEFRSFLLVFNSSPHSSNPASPSYSSSSFSFSSFFSSSFFSFSSSSFSSFFSSSSSSSSSKRPSRAPHALVSGSALLWPVFVISATTTRSLNLHLHLPTPLPLLPHLKLLLRLLPSLPPPPLNTTTITAMRMKQRCWSRVCRGRWRKAPVALRGAAAARWPAARPAGAAAATATSPSLLLLLLPQSPLPPLLLPLLLSPPSASPPYRDSLRKRKTAMMSLWFSLHKSDAFFFIMENFYNSLSLFLLFLIHFSGLCTSIYLFLCYWYSFHTLVSQTITCLVQKTP